MLTFLSLPILFIRWLIEKNCLYEGSKDYAVRGRSQTTFTRFVFFWPPTPLRLHFLWYKSLQKVGFLTTYPPSSCKRSLWMAPKPFWTLDPELLGEQAVFPSIYKLFFFHKLLEDRIACLSMMDMSLKKFSPYSEAPAATVIYSYKFHFENSQFQVSITKKMQFFLKKKGTKV